MTVHLVHALRLTISRCLAGRGIDPTVVSVGVVTVGAGGRPMLSGFTGALQEDRDKAPNVRLILGLMPEQDFRRHVARIGGDDDLTRLLERRGVTYLAFGFDVDRLVAAVLSGQANASMAEWDTGLVTTDDVLRLCKLAAHWARGRAATSEATAQLFEECALGGLPLHRSLLDPIPALTAAHRSMLARLLACAGPSVAPVAPGSPEPADLEAVLARFEAAWTTLEAGKASLRPAGTDSAREATRHDPSHVRLLAQHCRRACTALEELIAALEAIAFRFRSDGSCGSGRHDDPDG